MSSLEALFLIQLLSKVQDKSSFSCGVEALDRYLKQQASQDIKRHLAQVFVVVPKERPQTIAGFYTLSATSMQAVSMPEELARTEVFLEKSAISHTSRTLQPFQELQMYPCKFTPETLPGFTCRL